MSYENNLIDIQPIMGGFISKSVYNPFDARDVLQTTNAVLMSKKEDYDPDLGCFESWAFGVARWQIKAYLKKIKRNREFLYEEAHFAHAGDDGTDLSTKCLEKSLASHHNRSEVSEVSKDPADVGKSARSSAIAIIEPRSHRYQRLNNELPEELLRADKEWLKQSFRDCLTKREVLIFDSVCEGLSLECIANKLNSSLNATSTAKSRLVRKLKKTFTSLKASNKYDCHYQ